ncbi:tyrosine-type recombinase/integrase [Streptomyces sp. TRM68367]|uniref:tyrosine-type recombinase/integrase n=1 Tax=Streptomyces sp. TRM68367 TaxID=2758415 RepID=UPI00165C58AE|nr:tyrosine-type recombinase/integrase [Streptomyces sp. TRM68367]MBC9728471.1 tyrosine-type recombinase/integrase [Streptomyces sp. TRM68367]
MSANPDIASLLDSRLLHLAAERKSPQTRKTYGDGVRAFLTWGDRTGAEPVLDRPTVNAFVAALIDAGAEPSTARSRQLALRRFSAWLADEGEIPADQLVNLKPPKLDAKVVRELDEGQCRALIKVCKGGELRDRRDEAIVRLMIETGVRAGEVIGMSVTDADVKAGMAVVQRGKGGKGRTVPFGPQTARAVDRYLRIRRTHRLAGTPALWLGERGKNFTYDALYSALRGRAQMAGIDGFHPHVLRHTAAHRWLAAGGSEGGLMAVAGWSRRDMLDRYTKASSERRAAEEARALNLGDL